MEVAKTKAQEQSWMQSQKALIACSVLGFILAYAFLTRALDTGSYWHYLGFVVFTVLSTKVLVRAVKK